MVAVYGNLMVMGIAVALFVATINLGKRRSAPPETPGRHPTPAPLPDPPG
jgi:hypothetical protein